MANELPTQVLITGASGFLGRHLVERLLREGVHVEAWSRTPCDLDPARLAPLGSAPVGRLVPRSVDLASSGPLPEAPDSGWDVVFHFAGESRPSRFSSIEPLRSTVRMAMRLASHVASAQPGCRFILNSTAYVYGPSEHPIPESAPLAPSGRYGLSRVLVEDVATSLGHRMRVTAVRPFNVIGPGLPSGIFVTDLIQKLRSGDRPEHPLANPLRDFLDVGDAIEAYLGILRSDRCAGVAFNLCSGRAIRASEFTAQVADAMGVGTELAFEAPSDESWVGDRARLTDATGWEPRVPLSETIRAIIAGAACR